MMYSGSQNSSYPSRQTMIIVTFWTDYYPTNNAMELEIGIGSAIRLVKIDLKRTLETLKLMELTDNNAFFILR